MHMVDFEWLTIEDHLVNHGNVQLLQGIYGDLAKTLYMHLDQQQLRKFRLPVASFVDLFLHVDRNMFLLNPIGTNDLFVDKLSHHSLELRSPPRWKSSTWPPIVPIKRGKWLVESRSVLENQSHRHRSPRAGTPPIAVSRLCKSSHSPLGAVVDP